jgi:hypothetical protein
MQQTLKYLLTYFIRTPSTETVNATNRPHANRQAVLDGTRPHLQIIHEHIAHKNYTTI